MTSDHLGPISRNTESARRLLGPAMRFGLGFAVRLAAGESPMAGSTGDYWWGGAFWTLFVANPLREPIAVLMANGTVYHPIPRSSSCSAFSFTNRSPTERLLRGKGRHCYPWKRTAAMGRGPDAGPDPRGSPSRSEHNARRAGPDGATRQIVHCVSSLFVLTGRDLARFC
ncbi:MAG: hypothetical protein JO358_03460 [Alphaproteobacteria bacterium]|nr:hypothetical protein [Alphaproteobacteria bacterium]